MQRSAEKFGISGDAEFDIAGLGELIASGLDGCEGNQLWLIQHLGFSSSLRRPISIV